MNKTVKTILLAAAYALLLAALLASLLAVGLQMNQSRKDAEESAALQKELSAEILLLQEEYDAISSETQALKAALEEKNLQLDALTAENEQLKTKLADAEQNVYRFDVTAAEAGTLVESSQIDPDNLSRYFVSAKIVKDDAVYDRIYGKSYVKNDDISLSDLRYLKVLHYNFDHKIQVGEIIVNRDIAGDVLEIFCELYENEYEINSMYLIDNYWTGDDITSDYESIDANNTSSFCYRKAVGSSNLSNHALGRAIDLNPQQNPYVTYRDGDPEWAHDNADDYIDRDSGLAHVITKDDLAYQLFDEYGFEWGGSWRNTKDYQHFEKED